VICHVGIPKVINPECYIRDRKEINFTNRLYDLAYQRSLRYCHPERSEGSRSQILRSARLCENQNDPRVKLML
jgi:hypothetical protein